MVKEKNTCPTCGNPLTQEDGWLDQSYKPLPALVIRCTNPRVDMCGYKRWDRKPEESP